MVDLIGSFPDSHEAQPELADRFREVLVNHENFIVVLRNVGTVRSTHLGLLLRWLLGAKVQIGGGMAPPGVRIVADERVGEILRIIDGPFAVYATEREALGS
jgi:hypothetical protein